jgi:hypothetical protein
MKWKKLGRIFSADSNSEWLNSTGIVPIPRALDDYRYRVYFSPRDRQGRSNVSWLDIDIRNPTKVLRISEQPVLVPGRLGCFDDNGAMCCWIVEHNGMEMLYYQGWNLGVTVSFYVAVGLAIRPAGQPDRPFERISEGPILERCPEEPLFIGDPGILIENGIWRAWYQSGRYWNNDGDRPWSSYDIHYMESSDGIRWNVTGRPALTFANPGEVAMGRFCPLRESNGTYRAWYCYRGNDWGYFMGHATSPDGYDWTRRDDEVGIACDPESWEGPMICYPTVVDTEVGRLMFYNGGRYGASGFGVAVLEQD